MCGQLSIYLSHHCCWTKTPPSSVGRVPILLSQNDIYSRNSINGYLIYGIERTHCIQCVSTLSIVPRWPLPEALSIPLLHSSVHTGIGNCSCSRKRQKNGFDLVRCDYYVPAWTVCLLPRQWQSGQSTASDSNYAVRPAGRGLQMPLEIG